MLTFVFSIDSPISEPMIYGLSGNTYTLVENMTLNLTCVVEAGNPLATLAWKCNAGTVTDESSRSKTILRVTWLAERNKDRYCTCTAYHPSFSSVRSATAIVEVLCKYLESVQLIA